MPSYSSFVFSLTDLIKSLKHEGKRGLWITDIFARIQLEMIYRIIYLMKDHMIIDKPDYEKLMKI